MPMGGCGGAHIGSLCISIIILVIVIILIVMVVYNYNSTNNTTTTTQQSPQINNRAALAAAGIYRRNNGGTGGSGFRNKNKNKRKNGMTNGVSGNCNTGPCIASASCNNSSAACWYAHGQLPIALKNMELANNGYITKELANSLMNIRTTRGGGLTPKQMQTSYWSASAKRMLTN